MRSRQHGQAVVEFGIIALLFTALMFAVIDFGLLLNTWLSVSSASREIGRSASVGKKQPFLHDQAQHLNLPAVSSAGFSKLCCDSTSAIEIQVEYLTSSFIAIDASVIDSAYAYPDIDHSKGGCPSSPACHPLADDMVRLTVIAHGAQILTPLMRPFFGCTDSVNPNCNVALNSTTIMRFEGQGI
jgi:hypothetical protein